MNVSSSATEPKPIKILHLVEHMFRGGLETWLMHILRHIDRDQFQMDFMVQDDQKGHYDDEIVELGSKILHCVTRRDIAKHTMNYRRILKEYGPYDFVHSHYHYYNGYALSIARVTGVPGRISHSHNDTSAQDLNAGFGKQMLMKSSVQLQDWNATAGIAVSKDAARSLFGRDWNNDPRWRIIYTSIVPERFMTPVDGAELRREFKIPDDAFVIGHVGRFSEQKNHRFLVDIFAEIAKLDGSARLLLVGDGPLKYEIESQIRRYGLTDRVHLVGIQLNPEQLMMGLMDVFVLPSLHEGLPLVGIEAQASGLPFFVSSNVPEEVKAINELVVELPLSLPPEGWARRILSVRRLGTGVTHAEALSRMVDSCFNIEHAVKKFEGIYRGK